MSEKEHERMDDGASGRLDPWQGAAASVQAEQVSARLPGLRSRRRYWVVGASAGLGRALARGLSERGFSLVLSARDGAALSALAAELPGPAEVLPMDVTDPGSVRAAAAVAGAVDGLVWSAGAYWPMAARDWDAGRVETMCAVNFTGCARVLGQVVPGMIDRGAGHVVIVGSLAGLRGLPGATGYAASKAGVIGLAEDLHADTRGTGVRVQLVNPGYIRTRLTAKNDFPMPGILEPEEAAARIFDHMATDRFAAHFPRGFASLFRLGRALPDSLWYRLAR